MTAPSAPLKNSHEVFTIEKGRRERFSFRVGENADGNRAVEVRLEVRHGTEWRPKPHAFRCRADLAAAFAEGYAAVAAGADGSDRNG